MTPMVDRSVARPRGALGSLGRLLALALVLAHAGLLWQRIASGTLLEPVALTKWLASAGLLGWLLFLRSRRVALFAGRRAAIFWLAVVVVHAQVGGAAIEPTSALAAGQALAWFLPISIPLAAGVALLAALCSGWLPRTRSAPTCFAGRSRPSSTTDRWSLLLAFAPRPPPRLAALA